MLTAEAYFWRPGVHKRIQGAVPSKPDKIFFEVLKRLFHAYFLVVGDADLQQRFIYYVNRTQDTEKIK